MPQPETMPTRGADRFLSPDGRCSIAMALLKQNARQFGRLKLLVGGEWKESNSEQSQQVFNPATGEKIAEVPFAQKEEVNHTAEVAQLAFEKWKNVPITERAKYLFKLKEVLEREFDSLSVLNTLNHGKTLEESRGDMRRTIDNVDSAIAVAYTLSKGETMDEIAPGIDESMLREPLGVFAIVCPFNFPLMIPFWFLPYAIVLGDTVMVKPSEITPIPMQHVAELIQNEVRLPPGVFNLVHGAKDVVESVVSNQNVKGVCFVGSSSVARYVYKLAGEHGKRAIAQGGAKNSIVVMPDANLDQSVGPLVSSFFGNAGQRCLAGANLFAVGGIHESLVGKFADAARALKIGSGLDEGVQMGPVVSQKARQRIVSEIEKGQHEGARVVNDGRSLVVAEYPDGYYLGPTIFDDVSPEMKVAKEEVFGPVASVLSAKNLDDAIETINRGTKYGNMACIFTTSGRSAREFRRRVDAGSIGINIGVAGAAANFPFAGRKDSFFGILHAQIDTVDFFTDKKVVISRW